MMVPEVLLPAEPEETPTQQRVIDNVTITIDERTALIPSEPQLNGLCRLYIGDHGYGQLLVWFDRKETLRFIEAIARASRIMPVELVDGAPVEPA